MSAIRKQPLGTFALQQGPIRIDLPQRVNVHGISGTVTAAVTVAGGAADGALLTQGIQRLLRNIRVTLDGRNLVDTVTARAFVDLTSALRLNVTAPTNLAIPGVQAGTAVRCDFYIPFARPYLAQPAQTAIPGFINVQREFAAYLQFETATTNAASGAGTGALITGGDRTVTLAAPQVVLTVDYSAGNIIPAFMPYLVERQTAQVLAANPTLPMDLAGVPRFDLVLFRWLEAANLDLQQRISNITWMAGGGATRFWDAVDIVTLQRQAAGTFPAAVITGQVGVLHQLFADNGLLGTVPNPGKLDIPQFQFNVLAPLVNPGAVFALFSELHPWPGITSVQE